MVIAPILVLAAGILGAFILDSTKSEPEQVSPEVIIPGVQVMKVSTENRRLTVKAEGTVAPKTASQLTSEVSGRVIWVSSALTNGGFFSIGEILLKIDPREYELAVIRARSGVAQAKLKLASERQEAALAKQEWENLGEGTPTALVLRKPQIADAEASLAAAEAALQQAEYDLERTFVKAAYDGRVRSEQVDLGQFVSRGSFLASLYSVDFAEVRLPIADDELAYLNLPLAYRGKTPSKPGPRVILQSEFGGKYHKWRGRIVRTEGEIDPQTRMVHAIAQVKDPYGQGNNQNRPPLAVGMFVEAEIQGKWVKDIVVLPRTVLRGDQVMIINEDSRLQFRKIEILRLEENEVLVLSGLENGDQVCLSAIEIPVNGMKVRVIEVITDTTDSV